MIAVALALAATATDKVDVRPAADLTVSGLALLAWGLPEIFQDQLTPDHCRICDGPDNSGLPGTGSRGSLNGVDAWFHDAMTGWMISRNSAETVSNVWAYGLVPAAVVAGAFTTTGPHATDGAGWRALAIVSESTLISAALTQSFKLLLARKRPFVRYGNGDVSGLYAVNSSESRLGLPSGHTSLVSSLTFSLATTATLQESPAAPWLWAGAATATLTTGALRIMAEKHYFTDALAGAALGAASGIVIPLLHRRGGPLSSPGAVSIAPQGPGFVVSGRF